MRCLSCGFENPEGMKFCNECGASLKNRCPQCGCEHPPRAKFCGQCGTTLGAEGILAPAKSRKRQGAHTSGRTPRAKGGPTPARPQTASPEAERRQLTVMFCDLVGSTPLSQQLDPEDLRTVILAYQEACAQVIRRFEGYLARYVGDGLLVYFGYPQAHEDDAQRAVRAGLGIVAALPQLNDQLRHTVETIHELPLRVRIGIHTGLVVVGDMGGGGFRDPMAIVGETPNIAARLQGSAEPDTVVISEATHKLIQGLFTCHDLGLQELKGVSTPIPVYRVLEESGIQSRFEVAARTGLTPLVGREEELGLLRRHWKQAKEGQGQVVLLSGEAGIGKSRLVQELKGQVVREGATRIEFHCSPYHQNSALYPVTEHLQQVLQFQREDSPQVKLEKLEQTLSQYRFPQADTVPLLAQLLSLPHPAGAPPLTLSPQKQKQKTLEALVAWLMEEAGRQAVYCAWEDLHWADPSTLELLNLCLDQVAIGRMLMLLIFRPEFTPPWDTRSYLSQLIVNRLGHAQVERMVEGVTGGKTLPREVVQQVVSKTDGVPLFVEELTKMIVESGLVKAVNQHYELTRPLSALVIPATLQDSLMARLDRLAMGKEVAQLAATIGREFSHELLQAVSLLPESTVQAGLNQLVEAELIQQRRDLSQATYLFKHALIQDTAYESLLKSKRREYHQQIAQVLEGQFPETKETQPELLAHHYTAAGLAGQAIPYWHRAGQRAIERSANVEAIGHLTKGLEVLKTLPDTPERTQQELTLQLPLGVSLMATKGYAAPEVERTYARVQELCRQLGETPQLFLVLPPLRGFHFVRGELQIARELAEQYLTLAQRVQAPVLLLWAYYGLGETLLFSGELVPARAHLEQGIACYEPQQVRAFFVRAVQDPGVACLSQAAAALWYLGYPDQALKRLHEAMTLAQELSHPFSLTWALINAARHYQLRREGQLTQEWAEATITLSSEQGFPFYVAYGTILRGWALAEQGQGEEGIVQIRQGLAAWQATRTELWRPYFFALLAEAYGKVGQAEEGLPVLAEALTVVDKSKARLWEAELHRLKGTLTLQQFNVQGSKFKVANTQHPTPSTQAEAEAEACFQKAIVIARRQEAKSLELRAVMSLSRLWQQQGKKDEARQILADIYGWFTEGFDTADLQEAKALLEELS